MSVVEDIRTRLIATARDAEGGEPRPLVPERDTPLPYPIDALGPILADFSRATVEATQCDGVTAAQSALAVACLATQAHADVTTPAGLTRPLSLYVLTVAASGERKSAADHYALAPVRAAEDDARDDYRRDFQAYRNAVDAQEAERARIKRNIKSDYAAKRDALDALGSEPLPPIRPERTVSDCTTEGLIKTWTDCHGSRGLFTAEGALVIAGHGMSAEARLRTAATFSGLWDDGRAERVRAGDGHLKLRGRRLSTHLMAQPGVAAGMMGAADLNDQGLVGRFLIAEATERAGTRLFKAPPPPDDPRFTAYNSRVRQLLGRQPHTLDGRNELAPHALTFTPEAAAIWRQAHDHIEGRLGGAGEMGGVKSFGNKLAEHGARIAGVLTVFDDPDAAVIGAAVMARVVELLNYYAAEAVRLNVEARIARPMVEAERLRTWLGDTWAEPLISIPDVMQRGPNALRAKATAERCVATLEEHGWLLANGAAEIGGTRRTETFTIVRRGA